MRIADRLKHALALLALLLAASVARPLAATEVGDGAPPPTLEALGHFAHYTAGSANKQVLRDSSSGSRHRDGGGGDDAAPPPTPPRLLRVGLSTPITHDRRPLPPRIDAPRAANRARAPPVR